MRNGREREEEQRRLTTKNNVERDKVSGPLGKKCQEAASKRKD